MLLTIYKRVVLIDDDWDLEYASTRTSVLYSCPIDNPGIIYAMFPQFQVDLDDVIEGDSIPLCCKQGNRLSLSKVVLSPEKSK